MKIYLDMDGVCCNWMLGAMTILNDYKHRRLRNEHWPKKDMYLTTIISNWPEGKDPFGFKRAEFWEAVASERVEWWSKLCAYYHYQPMVDMIQRHGELVYLSSPPYGPAGANAGKGKIEWLQHKDRHGEKFRDFILTSRKELLANGPQTVLIDDNEAKCRKFFKHGGSSILFPQPWNGGPELQSHAVIEYLLTCLLEIKQSKIPLEMIYNLA